jgi:ammonium transporter Rh
MVKLNVTKGYEHAEYVMFRDIMVMLLLGFGYLMTFLKKYGLGAVGFTMMLTVLAMQLNLIVEPIISSIYDGSAKGDSNEMIHIDIASLIDSELAAATLLISYGALIGRATPLQLLIMAIFQSVFYAINKVVFIFGIIGAEDVGGM